MLRDFKFWVAMAVFQAFFGFAVFAITRDYYQPKQPSVRAHPATINPSASTWQGINENDISRLAPDVLGDSAAQSPARISRQAEEFFSQRQYAQAANAYKQLLEFDSQNSEVYNNLGLTLHYIGRSEEALSYLNEGVTIDPSNQRIWLTLGYVNSQLGNTEQARSALDKATSTGDNESIRQSALRMLDDLP
jgi:tetratricopeptide (TPR) repeat protein